MAKLEKPRRPMWLFLFGGCMQSTSNLATFSRRRTLLGFGGLAVTSLLSASCGGGSGVGGDVGGSGGGDVGGGGGSLVGAVWYARDKDIVRVPNGGTGTPVVVGAVRGADGRVTSYFPRISRKGSRYLQLGHHGAGSNVGTMIWIYDHATNTPYGYVDMKGFAALASMSPSGRYVGMRRAPELLNDYLGASESTITGLTVVDVSNIQSAVAVRDAMYTGKDSLMQFVWLDGDQFVYVTKGRSIVMGSAADDGAKDRVLGILDQQGLTSGSIDVHPDGKSMLVTLGLPDASSDIYLYSIDGKPIARMTNMREANSPQWSPDGSRFMFSYGSSPGCAVCGGSTCTQLHAPASARNLAYGDASAFDALKVRCTLENYWSSLG